MLLRPLPMLQEQLGQLRALVPLGAGLHAQAAVPDTSRICVHVALGFRPGETCGCHGTRHQRAAMPGWQQAGHAAMRPS